MVLWRGYGTVNRLPMPASRNCALYEGDDRLRVPVTVFSALLNRSEAI
jgi:hypothetical protein